MTPHWYRSRLFWSGLAGLLMLLVAWGVPPRSSIHVDLDTVDVSYGIIKTPSEITFTYLGHSIIGYPSMTPTLGWSTYRRKMGASWVPPAILAPAFRYEGGTVDNYFASIGIWFIVAIYTLLWYAAMVIWLRRKHRLMMDPQLTARPELDLQLAPPLLRPKGATLTQPRASPGGTIPTRNPKG